MVISGIWRPDPDASLTEKQRNGTLVTNTYNDLNLLTHRAIQPAAGVLDTTGETYEYDGASRLTKATDNDSTVIFGYDSLNRRTSESQNGKLVLYTYDKVNNLTSIQYPNQRIIEREFDVLNRINKIKQGGSQIASMEFIGRTYRMLSNGYQNGDVIKYLYDAGRRNTSIDAKNLNQQIINQYVYGYNKVNLKNYEQRLHDASKGDVYAYDALNRIKNIKFDAPDPTDPQTAQFAKAKTYNLDKVDNILKIVENKNSVDTEILTEMTASNAQLNQYSKFDQWNLTYDSNGNTTQKGTQQFSYNYHNQLVQTTSGGITFTLKYDPFGRRIEKNSNGNTIRFYYAGNQVIEERNSSDVVLKQYVWGNGIDELLRMDKYTGNTPTPYYFHTNDIGSTTAITDANGALVERVSYDTFGMPTFLNSNSEPRTPNESAIGNTTLFQGREFDTELNLYNYRARYYDPIMGRFLQGDPMGFKDSMNPYQSFGNNPVNFMDPMGLWTFGTHEQMMNESKEETYQLWKSSFTYLPSFYFKSQYGGLFEGLLLGSITPDMVEGSSKSTKLISAISTTFDIDNLLKLSLKEQKNPDRNSKTWQSHFGKFQYWHGMTYQLRSAKMTKHLIIKDVTKWLKTARNCLEDPSRSFQAGILIGAALHILQDTYSPGHTERDPKNWKIIKFNNYAEQVKSPDQKAFHETNDKLNPIIDSYYNKAKEVTISILDLMLKDQNDNFENDLMILLESILKLK
jgi:RHS repeat-associated protein